MALDMYDYYHRILIPLTPPAAVCKIMELIMSGGETTHDFSNVIARDTELQHWIRVTVQRMGFDKRAQKIDQMITLLGQDRIRDVIIGRSIERAFIKEEETLLGKLKAQAAKEAEKKEGSPKAAAPKAEEEAATEGDKTEEEHAESETLPNLSDFQCYTEYARRSEEVASTIRNSYPSQAFAGGIIFDYLKAFLQRIDLSTLTDPRLKKADKYVEEIFSDGLRCGIAANEIIQKISLHHQRTVFVTALVHNIGKALLLAYDPQQFEKTFLASTAAEAKRRVESNEAEEEIFDLDHAQAGSLYLGRVPYLAEIERSVDYHHNPHLLRFSAPKLYALSCVLRVSGALVKIYQKARVENADTEHLKDSRLVASEDFQFLKLSPEEWKEIKANYALKLMKVQL